VENDVRASMSMSASASARMAKMRALTKEVGHFREEWTREKKRREAADIRGEDARRALEGLKREHAALKYTHDKLKGKYEEDGEEHGRQMRALKAKLTKTLERESRQRKRSVSALRAALDALRSFAPTAPNGRALGGSAMSAVINELSSLTESIAIRDSLAEMDEETREPERAIQSSWTVSETERAKARLEVLERELANAYEIISIAEKERVILERELASIKRDMDSQASRHQEDLKAATEATARAIEMVRERNQPRQASPQIQVDDTDEDASRHTSSPPPQGFCNPSPPRGAARRTNDETPLSDDVHRLEQELAALQRAVRDALAEVDHVINISA